MSQFEHDAGLEEAAIWFARRRRGVMTIEERARYDAWRVELGNAAAMQELERLWALSGLVKPGINSRQAVAPPGSRLFARSALFALMCVFSLGVGLLSYSGHNPFWTRLDWIER